VSYTPKTKLVRGVAWPKYVKTKSTKGHIWDEKPTVKYMGTNGVTLGELATRVIEYVRANPWATCHAIGNAINEPTKRISEKCHQFAKTGRFIAQKVPSTRGRAFGFAFNENH